MMRLGRPEQPVSKQQDDPTTISEETKEPKTGRGTLLSRLKTLWSQNKEKPEHHSNSEESKD